MKKIIVTGSTGFLGTKLVNSLISKGYFVYAICHKKFIQESINLKVIVVNLASEESIEKIASEIKSKEIDCIFHLAWIGVHNKSRIQNESNKKIAQNLIELTKIIDTKCFVYSGSSYEYAALKNRAKINERVIYGQCKHFVHELLKESFKRTNISFASMCIANVYGCENNNIVSKLVDSLINKKNFILSTTGEQLCDFVYVDDVIRGMIYVYERILLSNFCKQYEIYIGNGEVNRTLKSYLRFILDKYEINYNIFGYETIDYVIPYEKLNKINLLRYSEFQYDIGFEEGCSLIEKSMRNEKK